MPQLCTLVWGLHAHSYFQEGCRKKCTGQSREVLWVFECTVLKKKKFERLAREVMDICLGVLKESDKSRFDSHNPGNSVLIISHITHNTFRDSRVHSFSDNLSRNSCKLENVESQDGDGNENLKKTIIALKQLKNNFAIGCRSFVHCFVVTARIQLTFYGENFFWFLNLELFVCQFFF